MIPDDPIIMWHSLGSLAADVVVLHTILKVLSVAGCVRPLKKYGVLGELISEN